LLRASLRLALLPALWFGTAGTLAWREAWGYGALWMAHGVLAFSWLARHDRALLEERMQWKPIQSGQTRWDKVWSSVAFVVGGAALVLPGLDHRFVWSHVPTWLVGVAIGLHVPLFAVIFLAMRENPFLARVVKVDTERGHTVVTTGPYRVVRHPMYAAVIPFLLLYGLALGSWWTLIPAGLTALLVVLRTHLEDETLHRELPGYREYAERTRWRLVPHVW
jgi:protein-S-isoprenylcysteine O-methyltransferase Ste14